MSSRLSLLAGLSALASLSLMLDAAAQEPAHEHGVLHLDVAVEGKGYTVALESPLDNLLGFEHAPRDATQEESVRGMASRLRAADAIFVANRAAGCKLLSVRLESAALPSALLGGGPGSAPAKDASQTEAAPVGHADLDGAFSFACGNPAALNAIDVMLFDAFARIRRIEVQLVTPKGQGKRTLTAEARRIVW